MYSLQKTSRQIVILQNQNPLTIYTPVDLYTSQTRLTRFCPSSFNVSSPYYEQIALFTASISGTTMLVSQMLSGAILPGMQVTGQQTNFSPVPVYVSSLVSPGVWTLSSTVTSSLQEIKGVIQVSPNTIILNSSQITSVGNEKGTGTGNFWDIPLQTMWGLPSYINHKAVAQYTRQNWGMEKYDISSQQSSISINFYDEQGHAIIFPNNYVLSCIFETC